MKADKLASFRVDSQLWEQFQAIAKSNDTTASALLVAYIKQAVSPDNAITSNLVVNTSSEVNLSIQDIDRRIDEKISQSIQDINTQSIQNIEDLIDSRIGRSIADGDIKDAIATSYAAAMGQFNGLLEEFQLIKKQMEELQSIPPVAADNSPAIDSPAPETIEDVITILGVADILGGDQYWEDKLIESGINQKIVENVIYLSEKLNIKVSPKGYVIARFNSILTALGYGNKKQGQHTKTDGKKQDKYIAMKVPK